MSADAEREQFLARFHKKREAGLVDIKFFVNSHIEELTIDTFIAAANQIDGAEEAGNCVRHHDFDDEDFQQQEIEAFLK